MHLYCAAFGSVLFLFTTSWHPNRKPHFYLRFAPV